VKKYSIKSTESSIPPLFLEQSNLCYVRKRPGLSLTNEYKRRVKSHHQPTINVEKAAKK
jgi:hypothetical protein